MLYPAHDLRVGICQMTSTDDVLANQKQVIDRLNQFSKPSGLDIITFPENALFLRIEKDAPMKTFDLSEPFFTELRQFCQIHQTTILLGSLPFEEKNYVSNAMVLVTSEEPARVVYRKIHLFDVDVEGQARVRESDQFRHGTEPAQLKIGDWSWGLSICYDLRFSELYSRYAKGGAHVLFIPSAFLVPTGQAHWHTLLKARAIESQCYVIAPAQGGEHRSVSGSSRRTYGHSLCVSPWGEILNELDDATPVAEVELKVSELRRVHQQIPMTQHRRLR